MKRWVGRFSLFAIALAAGCKDAPTDAQCTQLLDHLIDLEFDKAGATAPEAVKADLAKQKQAVSTAKSPEFLSTCTNKTPRKRVECALAAIDLDALARCDESD